MAKIKSSKKIKKPLLKKSKKTRVVPRKPTPKVKLKNVKMNKKIVIAPQPKSKKIIKEVAPQPNTHKDKHVSAKDVEVKLPKSARELLRQGKDDGFLVQDDIMMIFPEPEHHVEEIDEFFIQAFAQGIDIFESISTRDEADVFKSAEQMERELEQLVGFKHG